jgi:hypothetical protein
MTLSIAALNIIAKRSINDSMMSVFMLNVVT